MLETSLEDDNIIERTKVTEKCQKFFCCRSMEMYLYKKCCKMQEALQYALFNFFLSYNQHAILYALGVQHSD